MNPRSLSPSSQGACSIEIHHDTENGSATRQYDFVLPGAGICQNVRLTFAAERLAVRIRRIDLYRNAADVFPTWRCCAATGFHGVLWPRKSAQVLLDGDLLIITSAAEHTVLLAVGPPVELPLVLRLTAAVEDRLSEPFLASLEAHFQKSLADRHAAEHRVGEEGRELAVIIRKLEGQLQIITDSKLWRLTAAARQVRIHVKAVLKAIVKGTLRSLFSNRFHR